MLIGVRRWIVIGSVLLMTAAGAVWAQKEPQTVIPLTADYTLTLRAGWQAADYAGDGLLFANGDASLLVLDPEVINTLVSAGQRTTASRALISTYAALYSQRIAGDAVMTEDFAGLNAAVWYFSQEVRQAGAFIVVELAESTYAAFDIVAPEPDFEAVFRQVEMMAATLTTRVTVPPRAAGQLVPEQRGSPPIPGEPCTVRADAGSSARLYVGPGFNRSVVAFLPTEQDFLVIGRAFADDGSEWFKLDKSEAAPQSAAYEVWVLADAVDALGGCAAVEILTGSAAIPSAPP